MTYKYIFSISLHYQPEILKKVSKSMYEMTREKMELSIGGEIGTAEMTSSKMMSPEEIKKAAKIMEDEMNKKIRDGKTAEESDKVEAVVKLKRTIKVE